jgi:hypothetical protein
MYSVSICNRPDSNEITMETEKRYLSDDLMSELECPVCTEYMLPPIGLCEAGHSICSKCKPNLLECPTCRQPLLNTRNLALENLARKVEYPCTNRKSGCKETYPVDLITDHQSACVYAPITCPFSQDGKCPWTDIQRDLKKHLQECHSENVREPNGGPYDIIYPDSHEFKSCKVMFAYNEIFCIHIHRRANTYYIAVTYIAKPQKTCEYGYKISLTKLGSVESITVCHESRSDNEDLNGIFDSGNCFNLPYDIPKRYETYGFLRYELEIFEV